MLEFFTKIIIFFTGLDPVTVGAGVGLSAMGVWLLTYLIGLFLKIKQLRKKPKVFLTKVIYEIAIWCNTHLIMKMRNKKTRMETRAYADSLGDVINTAWDAGIYSQPMPIVKDE